MINTHNVRIFIVIHLWHWVADAKEAESHNRVGDAKGEAHDGDHPHEDVGDAADPSARHEETQQEVTTGVLGTSPGR